MNELKKRASGVLMHISSLPGKYGIGTMGKEARAFVDRLAASGQSYWQILPVGPTSFGDSPYQSFSTFAGNPYFIDPEILCSEGFLFSDEIENESWGSDELNVDYGLLYEKRGKMFRSVYEHFSKNIPADFENFCRENAFWLEDYALFMAIKDEHGGKAFGTWEDGIKRREESALCDWKKKCVRGTEYYKMLQYFFFKQWNSLKKYANDCGIKIIGDIPIYVSADSSDVWASPDQFCLDKNYNPVEVAGCPPDGFSETGQLWGNPVYNWDLMEKDNYSWWKKRVEMSLKIYDILRIDHFRGFDSYYCIPFGSPDARNGKWRTGPGMKLFRALASSLGEMPIIAEDLGFLTDSVKALLKDSGFPGMKLLQFAFDSREQSDYIPYKYDKNCVVYTGTHDNDTILGWSKTASPEDVKTAMTYLRVNNADSLRCEMMIAALSSVANTCVLTMQDLIGLGSEARMNTPSTLGTNWKWRASSEQLFDAQNWETLEFYTKLYGRSR